MMRRWGLLVALFSLIGTACRSTDSRRQVLKEADAPHQRDVFALDTDLGESMLPNEPELTRGIVQHLRRGFETAQQAVKLRQTFPKAHGCVRGTFEVQPKIPQSMARGAFKPGWSYKAWIRFANGDVNAQRGDGDGDVRGMAVKVIDVPGEKLLGDEKGPTTLDLLLINHPVFFADGLETYAASLQRFDQANPVATLSSGPATAPGAEVARAIAGKKVASPLATRYWSTVAYRLGADPGRQAVKYSLIPCYAPTAKMPDKPGPNYLREALMRELGERDACFEFWVQARTAPSMSVENALIEWKEKEAPFIKIALLRVPKQVFHAPAQDNFCEQLQFSPWHATTDHRPLGALNRVRRVVYEESARLRRGKNAYVEPNGSETF